MGISNFQPPLAYWPQGSQIQKARVARHSPRHVMWTHDGGGDGVCLRKRHAIPCTVRPQGLIQLKKPTIKAQCWFLPGIRQVYTCYCLMSIPGWYHLRSYPYDMFFNISTHTNIVYPGCCLCRGPKLGQTLCPCLGALSSLPGSPYKVLLVGCRYFWPVSIALWDSRGATNPPCTVHYLPRLCSC